MFRKFLGVLALLALCSSPASALQTTSPAAYNGNVLTTTPSNPASGVTSAAAYFMMGLGSTCVLTPIASTRMEFTITGYIQNLTAGDGAIAQLRYGTGTAPANVAALTGTQLGAAPGPEFITVAGATLVPFTISGIAQNLVLGVPVWFDAAITAVTGGTATIANLTCVAREV